MNKVKFKSLSRFAIVGFATGASLRPLPSTGRDLSNTGCGGELLGPGWLDGDQYRPDNRPRRSGCQPR